MTDPARPFDFIIDGELLRKSLQAHLLAHDISPVSCALSKHYLSIFGFDFCTFSFADDGVHVTTAARITHRVRGRAVEQRKNRHGTPAGP